MRFPRVSVLVTLFIVIFFGFSRAAPPDSLLVIREQQETFPLNPYTFFLKDYSGHLSFDQIHAKSSDFRPLGTDHLFFDRDKNVAAFWGRVSLKNVTQEELSYVLYFYPGIDTIEVWIENPTGKIQKSLISSIVSTRHRVIQIAQELCSPIAISTGITNVYFRIPNQSVWNRELASLIVNLAREDVFLNYFLTVRPEHGFSLGIISIMIIFHLIVYFFFRDTTYLLLVVNLLFTLFYLVLLKNYFADLPLTPFWLDILRYVRNPAAILVCITSLLFSKSFLNTRITDPIMHRMMNYVIVLSSLVVLCMIGLQFLNFMELIGIYLGVATCLLVIVTSIRSYKKGNSLALYTLIGFAAFLPVVAIFIFPFGYTDFRANETDIHYYAEAFRAVVFAVGVADRFKRVQQNAIQLQLENNQLALAKEIQIQAERDRIRRDLHDSLGGQLSALSIGLGRLHVSHNFDSVVNLKSITDKAIVELRDSLWLLDKNQVSIEELEQRINNLFWQYRKSEVSTILIVNVTKLEQQQLTSVVAGHLFRIIQESVQNAIKHSNATKVEVFLQKEDGRLLVRIEDNGCGFVSHSNLHEDHHYGLHNMRKRAEQIGGNILINSSVGHGTCVSINLDLDKV